MTHEPVPESINELMVQVCRLHHARAHVFLDRIGLYRGQPPLLEALLQEEGRTHSELAAQLHVQPATVSKMIGRMEKAGFVERQEDAEDQRVSRVYLTEAGRALETGLLQVRRQLDGEVLAGFTMEERVLLRRLLMQIRDNLLSALDHQ